MVSDEQDSVDSPMFNHVISIVDDRLLKRVSMENRILSVGVSRLSASPSPDVSSPCPQVSTSKSKYKKCNSSHTPVLVPNSSTKIRQHDKVLTKIANLI